jgi:hypothetical protein
MGEKMGPLLRRRNSWRTELFTLEESAEEDGSKTYYLDNVGIVCSPYTARKDNILEMKEYLKSIVSKLDSLTDEEILYNIDKNVIEHMQ